MILGYTNAEGDNIRLKRKIDIFSRIKKAKIKCH